MKSGGSLEAVKIKNLPKLLWDEFVYGGHLLAVGDALVIISLATILKIDITWSLPVVVYMSVLAINSYNRYREFEQDQLTNPERSNKMRKYIKVFPFLIFGLLALATFIVITTAAKQALWFMILLFVLGLLYTTLFKGFTKEAIGFKNFSIALPYALMVVFTSLYYGHAITLAVILITLFYYARIFISAMYFDIKDIESDKKEGLKTFAVVFGEKKTMHILMWLNYLSVLPLLFAVWLRLVPIYSLGLLFTIVYAAFYIMKLRDKSSDRDFLFNVIADGEFLFWILYILVARMVL